MHLDKRDHHKAKGFTLIELVLVIVILGIVSVSVTGVLKTGTQAYLDLTQREQLLRQGSFLIERLNREIAASVPNSVRVSGNSTSHCMEFVPINWSMFYLNLPQAPDTSTVVDVVEMVNQDGDIYNPGINSEFGLVYPTNDTHVYATGTDRRHLVTACSDDGDGDCATADDSDKVVQLTFDDSFALASPANRIYLANQAVSYCLRDSKMYRHEGTIANTQTIYTAGGVLMAEGLSNVLASSASVTTVDTQNPFRVIDSTLRRNAYVQLQFIFARSDELMPFLQEVHIPNVP